MRSMPSSVISSLRAGLLNPPYIFRIISHHEIGIRYLVPGDIFPPFSEGLTLPRIMEISRLSDPAVPCGGQYFPPCVCRHECETAQDKNIVLTRNVFGSVSCDDRQGNGGPDLQSGIGGGVPARLFYFGG